jgi:hypothetical protein
LFVDMCMSKVKKLLKQLENLIEERDFDSKTKITSLIKGMSQEERKQSVFGSYWTLSIG